MAGLETLEIDAASLAGLEAPTLAASEWRIEVTGKGRYWNWRRRGRNGASKYGGKIGTLNPERKAAYERNVERRKEKQRIPG